MIIKLDLENKGEHGNLFLRFKLFYFENMVFSS